MARLHLAVALDGAGWHPAAWREPAARPGELLTARYWADLVQQAERGLLDLVTIEDAFRLQSDDPLRPDDRVDRVRGRLDAVLIASRVAPATSRIGLVPTAVTTHTEPFHLSKAIATLDYVSTGRAGVRVQVSPRPYEARHIGRRDLSGADVVEQQFAEAADWVEVLRRLWDSWEDDAEIRDAATGRFVDRDKLHYIDFQGPAFSVKGPSITPRPPQGQPVVTALGHVRGAYELISTAADLGFVTPADAADAARIAGQVGPLTFADLVVFLDVAGESGADRLARLDELAGAPYESDAHVFAGSAAELADLLLDWRSAGLAGYRLRPGVLPDDLTSITDALVPELQRRGAFRTAYEASTLRGLLGLPRPANRYAVGQEVGA